MTTASPFAWFSPWTMARPKPCGPAFYNGTNSGIRCWRSLRRDHVRSMLPSSTTTISCGTFRIRSSRWRCSTIELMLPFSSRAGTTTDRSDRGRVWAGDEITGLRSAPASPGGSRHVPRSLPRDRQASSGVAIPRSVRPGQSCSPAGTRRSHREHPERQAAQRAAARHGEQPDLHHGAHGRVHRQARHLGQALNSQESLAPKIVSFSEKIAVPPWGTPGTNEVI